MADDRPGGAGRVWFDGLLRIGRSIGGRPILAATDEEAGVLIAEHAAHLRERFVLPTVAPGLPRLLATKYTLFALCEEHGIPTPRSLRPSGRAEVLDGAERLGYPVVVKNDAPWLRLERPAVPNTAIVGGRPELARARRFVGRDAVRDAPGVRAARARDGLDRARVLRLAA